MAQNVKKSELHLPEISSEVTESCLRGYDIKVLQPRHGYRFSVDSLLLADFVRIRKFDHILDIGTGCGVIAMVLAKKHSNVKIVALEKQNRSPVSGRLCKNSQEALARHEILTDLDQVLSATRYALHPGGRVSLIYSADRNFWPACVS
jgi:tRNA1Val (adenine37-N6)-methyltransferase